MTVRVDDRVDEFVLMGKYMTLGQKDQRVGSYKYGVFEPMYV